MRSLPAGIDQRSPARHPDWLGPDDLSLKIQEIREATDYGSDPAEARCRPVTTTSGWPPSAGRTPSTWMAPRGYRRRAAHRRRGDRDSADGGDPEARRALEDVGLVDEIDLVVAAVSATAATSPSAWPSREGGGDRPLGADGAELQQGDPGVTDYEGTVGVPRPVLPLPHRTLPGRHHHAGPRAAQAA